MLTGCLGTKHLKEGQRRLIGQSITAPPGVNQEALREMYAQRPNRRFLGIPGIYHLVGIYYLGEKRYDREKYVLKKERVTKKFDAKIARTGSLRKKNNLQFRKQKKIDRFNSFIENGNLWMQWGEPVSVFDSSLVEMTINRFKNYLFSEGYFQNNVTTKVGSLGRLVTVNYNVQTTAPYVIDSIFYRISDSTIHQTLKESERESFIRKGQRYREEDLSKERERIDLLLKDKGYYDFSRQYVDFPIDTAMLGNKKIVVMIHVLDPAKRGFHKAFEVDSVKFTTDAGVTYPGLARSRRTYRDVQYYYFNDDYNLKILSQRLFLKPGDLYSRSNTFSSQRQLANLDAFKFVNINYDTSGGKFIANIFTSPLNRYEWTNEVGVNVSQQGFPGPFYNINFKKRNIFGGLENFELNGRIGVEGVAAATDQQNLYKSTEAGINAALVFPQFIWPFREATQIRFGKYNPKTRTSMGYNYIDRPEYRRTGVTLANTYTWENQRTTQYSLALTNISLINSDIKTESFEELLETLQSQGNNLRRSFDPSFVSSMIFGITWSHNYGSIDKNSVFIRGQFETGGTTLNFINPDIITDQGLQYFKYLRSNLDFRRIRILSPRSTLAYRLNTGLAWSYSDGRTLPYEKFFFAGGSNSVRAWRPRRLGIGTSPPPFTNNPEGDGTFNYQIEKPGEILLEGSVELRSKIFGFVNGAIFVDAGNVWMFRQPVNRDEITGEPLPVAGNQKFSFNSFYKELGIGTGFGLRFDFTFLILRFDVGMKVYDPAREAGDRFVLDKVRFFKPYAIKVGEGASTSFTNIKEPVIYNIGIGYPF